MKLRKRRACGLLIGGLLLLSLANASAQHAPEPSAEQMLASATRFVSFSDVETTLDMEVSNAGDVQKSYRMQVKAKDRDRMRIEFQQPARKKGRVLLRVKDKMWMFLPDLGKSIVISARQSFLGSGFSNGDLLRTDLLADYAPRLLGIDTSAGVPAYQLELQHGPPT